MKYTLRKVKHFAARTLKLAKKYRHLHSKHVLEFPKVIQLPITFACNFDCVMCGMHHMTGRKSFTAAELRAILQDKLFCEVTSVGVNGGEPFLKNDLTECITAMVETLPKLHSFSFISNGYFTDIILAKLREIKEVCRKRNIWLHLSLSVDGVNDMQDFHRGCSGAWAHVKETMTRILQDMSSYVDGLDIICTITRYNIDRINEVEAWAESIGVKVAYNIATENVRIENQDRVKDFSVFHDEEARMLTQEFFYSQYLKTGSEKFFAIYLYLQTGRRYAPCPCMYNEWITLTPDSQIGFCATRSNKLGSGLERSSYDIVRENMPYLYELREKFCSTCSHYMYELDTEGMQLMFEDRYRNAFMR